MTDLEYLRDLAIYFREQRSPREYPHVTLARACDLLDARAEDEPTEPHALVLRICAHCGASTPAAWTPPPDSE